MVISVSLRSQIVSELSHLRDLAKEKTPQEDPLIIRTNYYENIRIKPEYNLFIYYAPFGHGKTHGVGLKLYHEAYRGELKDIYDVIVFQLRECNEPNSNPIELLKKMKGANVDPVIALIISSLLIGLSSNRCGHKVKSKCFSTIVEKEYDLPPFDLHEIVEGLERDGIDYLIKFVKRITQFTGKRIILVFDEFEKLISEGTFVQLLGFRMSALDFFSKLGSIMRRLFDRNLKDLKIVLLVQEAVLPSRIWEDLREEFKNSAALGVSDIARIEPYPARVYAEFVFEAIKRLVQRKILRKTGWVNLILENKHLLIDDFEKAFANIKQIPPRIAFTIADDYIGMLAESLGTCKCKGIKDLKRIIRTTYKETLNRLSMIDEAIRLQNLYLSRKSIYNDKTTFGNKDNMIDFTKILANEILKCKHSRGVINYSTFYGIVCVEGVINNELIVNVLLLKLKYSSRTSIKKVSESLANEMTKRVGDAVESFIIDKGINYRIRRIRINIYPIIEMKSGAVIYSVIAGAKNKLKTELGKKITKAQLSIFSSKPNIIAEVISPYTINEMEAIILYTWLKSRNSLSLTKDYVEKSYGEIIKKIKIQWNMRGE